MDDEQDIKPTNGRINVSVAVLEERLARWAETVQRAIDNMVVELRRRDDRFDNQIQDLVVWRATHEIQFSSLLIEVSNLKLAVEDRLKKEIEDLKKARLSEEVSFKAKVSLLKSQWAWLVAGFFFMSIILGILLQLKVLNIE